MEEILSIKQIYWMVINIRHPHMTLITIRVEDENHFIFSIAEEVSLSRIIFKIYPKPRINNFFLLIKFHMKILN